MKSLHAIIKKSALVLLASAPIYVFGADGDGAIVNPLGVPTIQEGILKILDLVIYAGGVLAVFFLIYSGFLFIKAQGNEKELETAKTNFLYVIIGIALLFGARVITGILAGTINQIIG